MIYQIREEAERRLSGERDPTHDFYHAVRTYNLGCEISRAEGMDLEIVGAAALLHDLFRSKEKELKILNYHVGPEALSEIEKILRKTNFPEGKIEGVLQAIRLHEDYSFGKTSGEDNSREGLVLQDADRLDALGAIGIARCFAFGGRYGNPLWIPKRGMTEERYDPTKLNFSSVHHFYDKLLKIKETMNTSQGRRIAEERHRRMEKFLEWFFEEWEGKT